MHCPSWDDAFVSSNPWIQDWGISNFGIPVIPAGSRIPGLEIPQSRFPGFRKPVRDCNPYSWNLRVPIYTTDTIIIIIIIAEIKVTLSRKVAGHFTNYINVARKQSAVSNTVMSGRFEKTPWTAATSGGVDGSGMSTTFWQISVGDFQVRSAATGNARSPSVVRRDNGTTRVEVDADRRRRE